MPSRILVAFLLSAFFGFGTASAQVLCIDCFDQLATISPGAVNLITNGSFELTTCPPSTGVIGGPTWCAASASYSCDITGWTSAGGGTSTYCSIYDVSMSVIPDGIYAPYFGNWYGFACSSTSGDTSCFDMEDCTLASLPSGYGLSEPAFGGPLGVSLLQTVSGLTPGDIYALEFWTGGEDGGYYIDGMFGVDVGFGDTLLRNKSTPPVTGIGRRFVIQFRATFPSHTIKFTNWGHICGSCSELALDDVRLYTIAELNPMVTPCIIEMTASAVATSTTCNGSCDGTATASAIGGVPPISFLWTASGATTATLTGLCAGTYQVVVTDSTGAVDTTSVTVLEPPVLGAGVTGSPGACGGMGSAISAPTGGTPPYTYVWSTTETTPGIDSLGPGVYTVTVTDSLGCSAVGAYEVFAFDSITLAMSSTVAMCSLATGTASVVPSGGDPPYTYFWSTSGVTPTISGLLPGIYAVTVTDVNGCFAEGEVEVTGTLPPMADAGLSAVYCEGEGGVTLSGSASGGTAPYYFEWWCAAPIVPCGIDSVFDDDPLVNPTASGWYYVQVTDFTGCLSNVDSVFVTVHPKPIVDAGEDLWLCGAPAPCEMLAPSISGSPGPFSAVWDPPIGLSSDSILNPCARPDTTTIYTLTVTDLTTGCTSEATTVDTLSSVTVHVNPIPIADAGPDRHLCLLDTLMLLGVGYGAGPSYSYEWSPFTPPTTLSANNIPNPLAFPDHTTDYVLVVWSNGCPSYGDTVTVNVHTNPTVDAGPDRDICQLEGALLDGLAGGDSTSSFYTFLWAPAIHLDDATLEDPTASPDTTTLFYVVATSEWGCQSATDSALVTVKPTPLVDAGDPLTICLGDSIVIPASYHYEGTLPADPTAVWPAWLPAANINDTALLQPTVWPTSTGFYHVALTHNTCTTYDSVLVTVIPGPQITLSADTAIFCEGVTTQLHASGGLGGASFAWHPGEGLSDSTATDPFASPDSTTTYTLTLEEGGCSSTDSITLVVIPQPEMAYFSSQPMGCAPLEVSFLQDVKDAIFYTWHFGDGGISNDPNPVHVYTQPGTYMVTLTAVNTGGCEATLGTLTIVVTDPGTAEFTADPTFPVELALPSAGVQFTDRSVNAASWIWDFGDNGSSAQQNPFHRYQQPGEYQVTLTIHNPDGCISQVVHGPFVVKAPDLFIPNVFSPNDDGSNDLWLVRYTGDQPLRADILDRWGNRLFSSRNKLEGWDGTDLQGTDVPDGVYYYRVRVGDQEYAGDVTLIR